MVDLYGQYLKIQNEINLSIQSVINSSSFIQGPSVSEFKISLQNFLNIKHVIPCANGTDALQIALMCLNLEKGAEIIIPSFSFAAPAEVVSLLGYTPVFAEVDASTFNITSSIIEKLINPRTRAIIAVHLFGQPVAMEEIVDLAKKYNLYLIEDNAQSLGANCTIGNVNKMAGTIGDIGTTSFFPSKNLGCMGDGGALFTNNDLFAERAGMIANHGQKQKYEHELIGINSRLDTLQAAILNVKLKKLAEYNQARKNAAATLDYFFKNNVLLEVPKKNDHTDHVYNQYTIKVSKDIRDPLKKYLADAGIPTMVYYPKPLHLQNVFKYLTYQIGDLPVTESLCNQVISLPMHTELDNDQLEFIGNTVVTGLEIFNNKKVLL